MEGRVRGQERKDGDCGLTRRELDSRAIRVGEPVPVDTVVLPVVDVDAVAVADVGV